MKQEIRDFNSSNNSPILLRYVEKHEKPPLTATQAHDSSTSTSETTYYSSGGYGSNEPQDNQMDSDS